ncbi:MAG: hypothetical protein JWM98_1617 [Thermoleophilia bacterium]|nr:hypothetical protein [Thermoleophilia bacterium]
MGGNAFLAWSAVLFALHLRGTPTHQWVASRALVSLGVLLALGRLAVHGRLESDSTPSIVTFLCFAAFAPVWSWRARAGDRWARAIGIVGVVAFAPNAPYILTDLFHVMQDVRSVGLAPLGSALFALEYGWFLVLGSASWIALLVIIRDWLRERRPRTPLLRTYVAVSAVVAFGVFLGRIERFHSWHPLLEPAHFAHEVGRAFIHAGPIGFTLIWWVVVLAFGIGGVALYDALRRADGSIARLGWGLGWLVVAALLVFVPLVGVAYDLAGVERFAVPNHAGSAAGALIGLALGGFAAASIARELGSSRALRWGVVAAAALPVVAVALTVASSAQWYAQFRGLCAYGPDTVIHAETCGG